MNLTLSRIPALEATSTAQENKKAAGKRNRAQENRGLRKEQKRGKGRGLLNPLRKRERAK